MDYYINGISKLNTQDIYSYNIYIIYMCYIIMKPEGCNNKVL